MSENELDVVSKRGVLLRRGKVNNYIFDKLSGVIQYGPLQGFKILKDSSWGNDKAAKLLGFYELEILLDLAESVKDKYFVDLGAADGYYAVGFVAKGLAKSAIAFEASEAGKKVIANTAIEANVEDKIKVYGLADEYFIDLIDTPLDETVFLIDIEGGEYDLLDRRNLYKLRNSVLFVEIHDFDEQSKARYQQLLLLAEEFFDLTEIKKIGRNPYFYEELAELDDSDHWLACSEGRAPDAKWLKLTPFGAETTA